MSDRDSSDAIDRINYNLAAFQTSVAEIAQLPADMGIEVAFAGRSNAGKSSTLNKLVRQKNLARTSKTPGRTQLINFFELDEHRRLVDLPGYGFAKVHVSTRAHWGQLIGDYLSKRQCLAGVVLIGDVRRGLTDLDRQLLDWCAAEQRSVHVLLNKADKLKRGAQAKMLQQVKAELKEDYPSASCQLFSAEKGDGLPQLFQQLDRWFHSVELSPEELAEPQE